MIKNLISFIIIFIITRAIIQKIGTYKIKKFLNNTNENIKNNQK